MPIPTSSSLFAETLTAVAQVSGQADRANLHLAALRSMFAAGLTGEAKALTEETLDLVFLVVDSREQSYLLRLLAAQQAKMGLFDEAANTFSFIHHDEDQKSFALLEIGEAMAGAGRFRQAIKIADRLDDLDDYEMLMAAISRELLRRGRMNSALFAASRIEPSLLLIMLSGEIATFVFRKGMRERARSLIRDALQPARGMADPLERDQALRVVAETYMELALPLESRTVAMEIDTPVERAQALIRLSRQAFAHEAARSAWEDARILARRIEEPGKKAWLLRELAVAFDEVFAPRRSDQPFEEAVNAALEIRNVYQMVVESVKLIEALAESGREAQVENLFEKTVEAAVEITDPPMQSRTLGMIAVQQILLGLIEPAEQTIRLIEAQRRRAERAQSDNASVISSYLLPLLGRLALAMTGKEADRLWHETLVRTRHIADPQTRAVAFRELAEIIADHEKERSSSDMPFDS